MRQPWRFIWDLCEMLGIDLGDLAPFVFGQMIGRTGRRIR